jgi:hypothetical protein
MYSLKYSSSHGVHATWFIVKPNRSQLIRIRDLIDAGDVRPIVDTVLPLSQAQNAYEHPRSHRRGKMEYQVLVLMLMTLSLTLSYIEIVVYICTVVVSSN